MCDHVINKKETMFLPGLKPETFHMLGESDNNYTTETCKSVIIRGKTQTKSKIEYI